MYFNLHTHYPTLLPNLVEIENLYWGQSRLPQASRRSVGLHPWYLDGLEMDRARTWLEEQLLFPNTLAVGEAGLDKVCATPWDLQVQAFQICVESSEKYKRPLILHCVRAYAEILALKKRWKPTQPWIFHGFDKHPSTAAMLLSAGCCLSFGAALFRKNSRAAESLRLVPEDQFFLETDDSERSIEAIYDIAAQIRGLELSALEQRVETNFTRIFGALKV